MYHIEKDVLPAVERALSIRNERSEDEGGAGVLNAKDGA